MILTTAILEIAWLVNATDYAPFSNLWFSSCRFVTKLWGCLTDSANLFVLTVRLTGIPWLSHLPSGRAITWVAIRQVLCLICTAWFMTFANVRYIIQRCNSDLTSAVELQGPVQSVCTKWGVWMSRIKTWLPLLCCIVSYKWNCGAPLTEQSSKKIPGMAAMWKQFCLTALSCSASTS